MQAAVFSDCGQLSTGPSGVAAQSCRRAERPGRRAGKGAGLA